MRICIVDDDVSLNRALRISLKQSGYAVDSFTDSVKAGEYLLQYHLGYDLIILDWMMPKKNGYEVCVSLRQSHIHTPILLLTAINKLENKVEVFNSGADDYLTKPFHIPELHARIQALVRRSYTITT